MSSETSLILTRTRRVRLVGRTAVLPPFDFNPD